MIFGRGSKLIENRRDLGIGTNFSLIIIGRFRLLHILIISIKDEIILITCRRAFSGDLRLPH
jgi:hypothetical protein